MPGRTPCHACGLYVSAAVALVPPAVIVAAAVVVLSATLPAALALPVVLSATVTVTGTRIIRRWVTTVACAIDCGQRRVRDRQWHTGAIKIAHGGAGGPPYAPYGGGGAP